ncbi:hypothetical protein LTR36_004965 [Oleoguttula mirabilis]|uniref:Uncharacterized protein n=1 Tax=Oleoguttula mirabilis TaxID=1507867 RepID=A0AAV9JVU2_9PEZI|nr:hypothetical protein LTR36_004965 [Oleoguttula mirabilis]
MAIDTSMDIDMDIDLTLDQEEDPEIARLHAEAAAFDALNGATDTDAMNGVEEAPEEGEVDMDAPVPKVHLRGVDKLESADIRNFANDHYPSKLFKHVQWIDDTSVNLVYETEVAAAEALQAFSAQEEVEPLKIRAAKQLSTHPDVELFVRQAVVSDVKVKDARLASKFYLFNPQHDPENGNRKRRFEPERTYRTRDYSQGYKRNRRDVGDDLYSRRSSKDEPFDVDLYDDDPVSLAKRAERRESYHSGSEYENGKNKLRLQDDLMTSRDDGRLRNRSASPMRDGDGRFGFNDDQPRRRTARPRSPTPPRARAGRDNRDNRAARDNFRKELFPDRKPTAKAALTNGHTNGDLFPNHSSPPTGPRELMPNHRRQDARDIDRETREVVNGIGNYTLDGADERETYTRSDRRRGSSHREDREEPRDLFSRITGAAPKVESGYGRLHDRPTSARAEEGGGGFNFKGAGDARPSSRGGKEGGAGGFSILGASRDRVENPLVKELFPMKAGGGGGGSGGKDLFDGRIKGRGTQRRRAEDLF